MYNFRVQGDVVTHGTDRTHPALHPECRQIALIHDMPSYGHLSHLSGVDTCRIYQVTTLIALST